VNQRAWRLLAADAGVARRLLFDARMERIIGLALALAFALTLAGCSPGKCDDLQTLNRTCPIQCGGQTYQVLGLDDGCAVCICGPADMTAAVDMPRPHHD
jgi:hypothetical protein